MRFDIELNKVSTLQDSDLKYISTILYDPDDTTVLPAVFDRKTLFSNSLLNRGSINTSKFNNFDTIPMHMFPSYVIEDGLGIYDTVQYNSLTYVLMKGGSFYSANKDFIWSSLYAKVGAKWNGSSHTTNILGDYIETSVSVYTLSLKSPCFIDKKRVYTYIKYDGLSNETTFAKSTDDNIFTIINGIVYLNCKQLKYNNAFIGKGDGKIKSFALPEFPVENISIDGFNTNEYKVINGIVIFDTPPVDGEDISITADIVPIVSYKRNVAREDIVYLPYNINPSTANLKNGIVCAYNSYSNLNTPDTISISSENINQFNNTYKVTASLKNSTGIPISNKKITFSIEQDGALFAATNSNSYIASTLMNGSVSATLFGNYDNMGIFLQKEWVTGNTINIPGDININHTGDIFLYVITDDDPIIGDVTNITEYYTSDDITSYFISGRRIAYVELANANRTLTSKYIKPISINKTSNIEIPYRNLGILNQKGTIRRTRIGEINYNGQATQIIYSNGIPNSGNVAGYYMVMNKEVTVYASYQDDLTYLKTNLVTLEIKNIKSESPFTISGTPIPYKNTSLNNLGYYNVSDYLNNGYSLYPCSYGCIHSDVINKKCLHANKVYHSLYEEDNNGIFCIHTPEYDAGIQENKRCKGVEARILNPFTMANQN